MKEPSEHMIEKAMDRLQIILDDMAMEVGGTEFTELPAELQRNTALRVVAGAYHEHRLWQGRIATLLKDLGMKSRDRVVLSEQDDEVRRRALMELLRAKESAKEIHLVGAQASALVSLI